LSYFSGKAPARAAVWERLPPHGRIPNFAGAKEAAERLFAHPILAAAKKIKVNADAPQLFVRTIALERGITVFIETPLETLPDLDAIVVGSVVVTRDGYRCGRGVGCADIEYAILRELGHPPVPVFTTVHPLQFVRFFPAYEHDIPLSGIATPDELIAIDNPAPPPRGIDWSRLPEERIREMPILAELRARGR
jgi:5-formyltetrahydrofolate cyclo-ligase